MCWHFRGHLGFKYGFLVARVNVFRFICNDNNSTKLHLKLKYTRQNQSFVDNVPRQHEHFPPKSTCFSDS